MRPTSRTPLVLRPVLLALPALLAAGAARGPRALAEPPERPTVAVPVSAPIALDGAVTKAEWETAAAVDVGLPGSRLLLQQSRGSLLLAFLCDRAWPVGGRLLLYFRAGADVHDDPAGIDGVGGVRIDYEPREHGRPHAIVQSVVEREVDGAKVPTPEAGDGVAVFRSANLWRAASVEGAVSLAYLGVSGAKPAPLRWMAAFVDPTRAPSTTTFPAGLDIGARTGALPPDLASLKRWATSAEWDLAGGRGAFSRTEWDAWVVADRDLAAKGLAAHALAREYFDTSAPERPKRDAEVEDGLLAPLRWIAAREPLTAVDLRARAAGLLYLNRFDEALLSLDDAQAVPGPGVEDPAVRALVLRSAQRYEEAAKVFDDVASRLPPDHAGPARAEAQRLRDHAALAVAEEHARRADDAREDLPLVLLKTTKGDVVLRLLEDDVPTAVAHFVHLVEETKAADGTPFYDGTFFHRVAAAGLVQGGDPRSRTEGCEAAGSGGSPWFVDPEKNPRHGFFRGSVGFAMAADRRIRSQFFVLVSPAPFLEQQGFTCFATVSAGMETIDRLETCDRLISARVLRKRPHPYAPEKKY